MLYRSAVSEVTLAVRMSVLLLQLCFLVIELFNIYCFLLCSFTGSVIIVVHANSFPPESWVRASAAQIAHDKNSNAGPRLYI